MSEQNVLDNFQILIDDLNAAGLAAFAVRVSALRTRQMENFDSYRRATHDLIEIHRQSIAIPLVIYQRYGEATK
jgi:copper oxidase (laccase) domain-containing protein